MLKSIYTFAAAMIAAGIVALPSMSPQEQARGPELGAKGDRIDARPLGIACSQPYFEAPCLRDPKTPFGEAGALRVLSIGRPLPTDPKPR